MVGSAGSGRRLHQPSVLRRRREFIPGRRRNRCQHRGQAAKGYGAVRKILRFSERRRGGTMSLAAQNEFDFRSISERMSGAPKSHASPLSRVFANGAWTPRDRDAQAGRERPDEIDWSILMARAQSGDAKAYRRLLEEITPYLRSLVTRRQTEPTDVEDSVQDILLTIHAIRNTYDPARPFGPWLVTIAHRRIVDRLRRRARAKAREIQLAPEHETLASPQANLAETRSDGRTLREAVEGLSPGQRAAIRLLKLEEMSLKEAAAVSGMSVAALKVASHRALSSLRKILGRSGRA